MQQKVLIDIVCLRITLYQKNFRSILSSILHGIFNISTCCKDCIFVTFFIESATIDQVLFIRWAS